MGLFHRKGTASDRVRVTALVVEADPPPERAPSLGSGSHWPVRLLIDPGPGQKVLAGRFRNKPGRWLAPGMNVEVILDAARTDFELCWEQLPSIEARVAANDPTLADPIGARRAVTKALGSEQADAEAPQAGQLEAALEQAARQAAPPGMLRAVVLVASIRGHYHAPDGAAFAFITYDRPSAAVLAVNIPGRPPYAVYASKFKVPKDRDERLHAPLPALVAANDPTDVHVLWEELPARPPEQTVGWMSLARSVAQMRKGGVVGHLDVGIGQPAGDQQPQTPAATGEMTPQLRRQATARAKRTLKFVRDPAMRKTLIEQYRAAGIELDESAE